MRATVANYVKNASYVHSRPLNRKLSGHGKTAIRQSDFKLYVHSSNGISRIAELEHKQTPASPISNKRGNANLIGRVDTVSKSPALSGDYLCPLSLAPSGHSGHNSDEVTL